MNISLNEEYNIQAMMQKPTHLDSSLSLTKQIFKPQNDIQNTLQRPNDTFVSSSMNTPFGEDDNGYVKHQKIDYSNTPQHFVQKNASPEILYTSNGIYHHFRRRRSSLVSSPTHISKNVRFSDDQRNTTHVIDEMEDLKPKDRSINENDDYDAPYSPILNILKKRHKKEIEEQDKKYKLLDDEFREFQRITKQQISTLTKQIEAKMIHEFERSEEIRREILNESEKTIFPLQDENRRLKFKIKEQEETIMQISRHLESLQQDFKNIEHNSQKTIFALTQRINSLEGESLSNEKLYAEEKKKLKEFYGTLVNELTIEMKHLFQATQEDILQKESYIKSLENKIDEITSTNEQNLRVCQIEIGSLKDTNRYQKKMLEENKTEVIRLSKNLDEKKKELLILEGKTFLGENIY